MVVWRYGNQETYVHLTPRLGHGVPAASAGQEPVTICGNCHRVQASTAGRTARPSLRGSESIRGYPQNRSFFRCFSRPSRHGARALVEVRRGEVWWVRLDPTLGSEIAKKRPCVILSGNVFNKLRRTIVVIPLSSSPQPGTPLLVPVRCDGRDVVAVTDQIRAIAKQRLVHRLGELSSKDLEAVEQGVREVLEL